MDWWSSMQSNRVKRIRFCFHFSFATRCKIPCIRPTVFPFFFAMKNTDSACSEYTVSFLNSAFSSAYRDGTKKELPLYNFKGKSINSLISRLVFTSLISVIIFSKLSMRCVKTNSDRIRTAMTACRGIYRHNFRTQIGSKQFL